MKQSDVIDGLWGNARDSIEHAIDHFSELARFRAQNKEHHAKWAILSVHHAAECYCNLALLSRAPKNPELRRVPNRFPSLRVAVKQLLLTTTPSPPEQRLLELFKAEAKTRDSLTHRLIPDDLDASISATALLGLLHILRREFGDDAKELVRWAALHRDVFDAIHWRRHDEYFDIASELVAEDHPDAEWCPMCRTNGVVDSFCEVCFTDLDCAECPECGYPSCYYSRSHAIVFDDLEVECPHCRESWELSRT